MMYEKSFGLFSTGYSRAALCDKNAYETHAVPAGRKPGELR
jgi:hypothetical protein